VTNDYFLVLDVTCGEISRWFSNKFLGV